jgi:hypothetical protein
MVGFSIRSLVVCRVKALKIGPVRGSLQKIEGQALGSLLRLLLSFKTYDLRIVLKSKSNHRATKSESQFAWR